MAISGPYAMNLNLTQDQTNFIYDNAVRLTYGRSAKSTQVYSWGCPQSLRLANSPSCRCNFKTQRKKNFNTKQNKSFQEAGFYYRKKAVLQKNTNKQIK